MSFTFEYLGLDGKILVTDFALRATASLEIAVFTSSDGIPKDRCLTPLKLKRGKPSILAYSNYFKFGTLGHLN